LASSRDDQLLFPVPRSLKPEISYLTIKIPAILTIISFLTKQKYPQPLN
jgi:hypothetical protein